MLKRSWKAQSAADLRTAARMIERHGWSREPYPTPGGSEGASTAAALCLARFGRWPEARGKQLRLRDPRYRRTYETFLRHVQAQHVLSICDWNRTARSVDDVLWSLRAVADALDPPPVLPLMPVFATATERRRSMRDWMVRQGMDVSDLPPLDDDQVPDYVPAAWVGVSR